MHNDIYINFHLTLNLGLFLIFMRFDTYMQNVIFVYCMLVHVYCTRRDVANNPLPVRRSVVRITCFGQVVGTQ